MTYAQIALGAFLLGFLIPGAMAPARGQSGANGPVEATAVSEPPAANPSAEWDAMRDFRADRNPNGVWTYGETLSAGGVVNPLTASTTYQEGVVAAYLAAGTNSSAQVQFQPGGRSLMLPVSVPTDVSPDASGQRLLTHWTWNGPSLALESGAHGEEAVLRFTAPRDGRYRVRCLFYTVDPTAQVDVALRVNSFTVWKDSLILPRLNARPLPPVDQTVDLRTGETVDMAVQTFASTPKLAGADFKVWRGGNLPSDAGPSARERNGTSPYSLEEEQTAETAILSARGRRDFEQEYRLLETEEGRCRAAGYRLGQSRCTWELLWIDGVYRGWRKCEEHLRLLVRLEDQRGDPDRAASAREKLGALLIADGRRTEGEAHLREAFALREHRRDQSRAAVRRDMERFPCLKYPLWNTKTSPIPSPGTHYPSTALPGPTYEQFAEMGYTDRAIGMMELSLAAARNDQDNTLINRWVTGLMLLYPMVGLYDDAKRLIERSLKEGRITQAHAATLLGGIALKQRLYEPQAHSLFDTALHLLQPALTATRPDFAAALAPGQNEDIGIYQQTRYEIPSTLEGLAEIDRATAHPERALPRLMRAFQLRDVAGPEWECALTCRQIGRTYEALGDGILALLWYRTARQRLTHNFGRPVEWIQAEIDCAHAFEMVGRNAEAEDCYREATRLTAQAVQNAASPFHVSGFYQEGNPWTEWAAFQQRHGMDPAESLVLLEQGKALYLPGAGRAGAPERSLTPEDAAQQRAFHQAFAKAGRELLKWERGDWTPTIRKQRGIVADYRAAQEDIYRFEDYLRTRYPLYRQQLGATPPDKAALLHFAQCHPDTLYLAYAIPSRGNGYCLTLSAAKGITAVRLPVGLHRLEAWILAWRDCLQESTLRTASTERVLAAELYAVLLAPVEKAGLFGRASSIRRLVIIPDGQLREIPFLALADAPEQRLIQRFPVSTALSLGVLSQIPSVPATAGPLRLLCAAYPCGNAALSPAANKTAVANRRRGFEPLQCAEGEVAAIRKQYPNGTALVGEQATESALKQEIASADVLHFATHALVDRANGLRSRLLLAPERDDSPEEGCLEAREVGEMPLRARMAVLSACETGVAQPLLGNGLLGFAWGFYAAGCPSVVSSLWEVDDAATSQLMADFYRRLRRGDPKDVALRAAICARLRDPATRPPFYWAAWQVIGDVAPLSPASGGLTAPHHKG